MIKPEFPDNELERISCLKEYNLLDTLPESDFDDITYLVASICNVPISLITLLDTKRNFLKSHHGIDIQESPRDISFCGHAILQENDIFIIEDARKDERFIGNPLVDSLNAVFYAGVPLKNKDGLALGTLCVYDHQPRQLSDLQKKSLITIAKQVMNLFDLRKNNRILDDTKKELTNRNKQLSKFASHVSHDLKSPLSNIISLTQLLKEEENSALTQDSKTYIKFIEESADTLKDYIDGILVHYKAKELIVNSRKENTTVDQLFKDVKKMYALDNQLLKTTSINNSLFINKPAITQILMNLVDNAIKYNSKSTPEVILDYSQDQKHHIFSVIDNGNGIETNKQKNVFELFNTNNQLDKKGKKGTGIGLFTVKNLVEELGGNINIVSELGKGSTFKFTIAK